MDSMNRKRRGFIKGRIILSLYRTSAPKPTASTFQFIPQASSNKKLLSFLKTDNIVRDSYVGAGDNNVDMKASNYLYYKTYISYVQERFKLERVDSERRNSYQDTAHK
ncbi:hypothetical protein MKW94_003504 [Papaver nudicaule]|uniref:Uncharacterized protein n=1 Tax=Papaver nudicaule TaxID=74823 RepID=A0AA42AZ42_PAPNU|nr:hypothetical protein [Papaver nudicaule]